MQVRRCCAAVPLFLVLAVAACSKSSSAPSVSFGQPSPVSPPNGAQISNLSQPVTLTVQNATVSGSATVIYTFEVSTDSGFANKAQTKGGVAAGTGGTTAVTLDSLLANQTYYWHAQASGGGSVGSFGPAFSFSIGPVVTLGAPVPVAPAANAIVSDRPLFTVTNAIKVGPTGTVVYRFEIADSTSFTNLVSSGTVAEGAGQTNFTPGIALPAGKTLYWRVTAIDQTNNVTGPSSATLGFKVNISSTAGSIAAQEGLVLWPGTQPPGTPGQASLGDGWGIVATADFQGNPYLSPTLENLRVFDLLDRGMDPNSVLGWMNSNGYPTNAVYYSNVAQGVFGFAPNYMTLIGRSWSLVRRVGA